MANATATLSAVPSINATSVSRDESLKREKIYGICGLLAGSTYVALGIPLLWQLTSATGSRDIILTTQPQPANARFWSKNGGPYDYKWDEVNNKLRIYQAGVELAGGAAITADLIGFKAEFIRGL